MATSQSSKASSVAKKSLVVLFVVSCCCTLTVCAFVLPNVGRSGTRFRTTRSEPTQLIELGQKRRRLFVLYSTSTGSQGSESLTERSFTEEEIFKKHQSILIMATDTERVASTKIIKKLVKDRKRAESRANTGGSGFGGGGAAATAKIKKPKAVGHVDFKTKVDKSGFGAVILDQGVARIDACLSLSTAEHLLAYINQQLLDSVEEVDSGGALSSTRFANVLSKNNRWDMLLPLEESEAVMRGMFELFEEGSVLGSTIESILGKDAELYELASLVSDPGSQQQVLHPDFPFQDTLPPALTCFVALQDIEVDMGATTFMPKSASELHHEDLKNRLYDINSRTGLIAETPTKLSTLCAGDVSLYNPMTLHCGGANRSNKRRGLFYFSFKNPTLNPFTDGASLRPELLKRGLTLKSLRKLLHDWKADQE